MAYNDTSEAVWNMDDEILKIVKNLKSMFIIYMKNWDLENAYWTIRQIRMEIEAKLKDKERTSVGKALDELEKKRKLYLKDRKINRKDFFVPLENYYIKLNRLMKEHGLYFRERDDTGL